MWFDVLFLQLETPRSETPLDPWNWFGHYMLEATTSVTTKSSVVVRIVMMMTGVFTMHSLTLYQGIFECLYYLFCYQLNCFTME